MMITTDQAKCFGGPWDGQDVDVLAWRVRVRWFSDEGTRYTTYQLHKTDFGWRYFAES